MSAERVLEARCTSNRVEVDPRRVGSDVFLGDIDMFHMKYSWKLMGISCGHIYVYMVIDLKVLVKRFNCEDRSCYVENPRKSFFRVRDNNIFIRESFPKVGCYNHYCIYIVFKAPGVRQEKGTGEFRFGSGSVPCLLVLLDNHFALHK